jgi:hypothetical protein
VAVSRTNMGTLKYTRINDANNFAEDYLHGSVVADAAQAEHQVPHACGSLVRFPAAKVKIVVPHACAHVGKAEKLRMRARCARVSALGNTLRRVTHAWAVRSISLLGQSMPLWANRPEVNLETKAAHALDKSFSSALRSGLASPDRGQDSSLSNPSISDRACWSPDFSAAPIPMESCASPKLR